MDMDKVKFRIVEPPMLFKDDKKLPSVSMIDDMPDRDSSLGLLSFTGDTSNLSDASKIRELEFQKAKHSLNEYDLRRKRGLDRLSGVSASVTESEGKVDGLPSRFLRPSLIPSESSVCESDLLPTNSSTPRESLFNIEQIRDARLSVGREISALAKSLAKDFTAPMDNVLTVSVNKALDVLKNSSTNPALSDISGVGDVSFQSGSAAAEMLQQDEQVWKRQNDFPATLKDISQFTRASDASVGSFFLQRSDDIPHLFAKSPPKQRNPIPLIDSPITEKSSLQLSDIQEILSSEVSTGNALEQLLKPKKKSKSPQRPSIPKLDFDVPKNTHKKSPTRKSAESRKTEKSLDKTLVETVANISLETKENTFLESKDNISLESKENICPDTKTASLEPKKSILSTRSSSSISSLPNGKLPIATTKTELIWGCIKPGKTSNQEILIRNRSGNRVGIHCTLSNPAFRINKDNSELSYLSTVKLVLHPYESRVINLMFSPTTIGAAVDCLTFTPSDPNHKQTVSQHIKLFGYGGSGQISIYNIIKDTAGKFLLALGNINEKSSFKQSFVLKNRGSLATFAYMYFIPNTLQLSSSVIISETGVILGPNEQKEVVVTYELQKKDFNYIRTKIPQSVIDLGKLHVIHGTEVDRARLRKVCHKAKERKQYIKAGVLDLIGHLPEVSIPDLARFKESISSIEEIVKLFHTEEITLTLEQDIDVTLPNDLHDETGLYHSLCEKTMALDPSLKESCVVEPTSIILTPPDKMRDRIFFTNNNKRVLHFEANAFPKGLVVKPSLGAVDPGETVPIELHYTNCNDKTVFKVKILVDNDFFEVEVKIVVCRR